MSSVGVVDIGTNSMRLLIADGPVPGRRWEEITGLGHGVDATGQLGEDAMEHTIQVLEGFSRLMSEAGVERRAAIATSATRQASNGEAFLDWAEIALGIRPEVITGEREGYLALAGARSGLDFSGGMTVCDIGGGSTEIVNEDSAISVEVGSVRLTDGVLPDRPPHPGQVDEAFERVEGLFSELDTAGAETLVGVAGTWTSLAAMSAGLSGEEPSPVHGRRVAAEAIDGLFDHLLSLTTEETAGVPGLNPRRAPVILAGVLIAIVVTRRFEVDGVIVSERDTLDGLAAEVLALP